jgi:hypothetical protein
MEPIIKAVTECWVLGAGCWVLGVDLNVGGLLSDLCALCGICADVIGFRS